MTRKVLLIESRLAFSQLVKSHLESNDYDCTHILGSSGPQIVTKSLSAVDGDGRHIEIQLADFPVAILDMEFGDSTPGQELIVAMQAAHVFCITFNFKDSGADLQAFDTFLRETLPKVFLMPSSQETKVGKVVTRFLRFIWRGLEWLIR
jgi:hypothetical protein